MRRQLRRLLVLVAAMGMVASMMALPVSGEPGSQTWRLLGEDHNYTGTSAADGTDHLTNTLMSTTLTATNTSKLLNNSKTMWWYADYAAQIDLGFPAGSWMVRVDHEQRSGWTWYVDIYKVASDGTATLFANGSASASNTASGITTITCPQAEIQTFSAASGDRLALRLRHDDSSQSVTTYFYKDSHLSSLTSPESAPDYPVTELSPILLMSLGATLMGAVMVFRTWRNYGEPTTITDLQQRGLN